MKGVRVAPDSRIIDRINVSIWNDDQLLPDLAFDGSSYLVAWGDRRNTLEQIYYTRVTGDGHVLNPIGKRLANQDSTDLQGLPVLASNGENYFLAWMGSASIGTIIFGTRIGLNGRVLDSVPLQFTSDTLFQNHLALGTDGENYLVLWCGETPSQIGEDLYCCRVSSAGQVLDSIPRLICRTTEGLMDPAVAFLGDRYLVTWTDMRDWFDVYGCRVMQDGTVLDPDGFPICARESVQRESDVATDGKRFLVVWSDMNSDEFDVYAAWVDTGGMVGVKEELRMPISEFRVLPNPASGPVLFETGQRSRALAVDVYDAGGRLVIRLQAEGCGSGIPAATESRLGNLSYGKAYGTIAWDRCDLNGKPVQAGVYIARLGNGPAHSGCRFVLLD